jgi:hypothetical protein
MDMERLLHFCFIIYLFANGWLGMVWDVDRFIYDNDTLRMNKSLEVYLPDYSHVKYTELLLSCSQMDKALVISLLRCLIPSHFLQCQRHQN